MLVAWDMNQHLSLCWVSQPSLLNLRFCPLPSPLPRGEGRIAENLITVDFQRHYSLSPWERARERAKHNNLKKRRLKKMATKSTHDTNTQKKNIKNNCRLNTFQTTSPHQNGHTSSEIRFPQYLKLGNSTWVSSQFLLRLRSR